MPQTTFGKKCGSGRKAGILTNFGRRGKFSWGRGAKDDSGMKIWRYIAALVASVFRLRERRDESPPLTEKQTAREVVSPSPEPNRQFRRQAKRPLRNPNAQNAERA